MKGGVQVETRRAFTFRLVEQTAVQLEAAARMRGVPVSQLVAVAVEEHLRKLASSKGFRIQLQERLAVEHGWIMDLIEGPETSGARATS